MKKRKLGKTGIKVSEIAFGGVEIGIPYGIGIKSPADMLSEAEAIKLLNTSLDSGINFFDTARMYGESENIIGKAFKQRRDEVVICTKCRHFLNSEGEISDFLDLKKIIENSLNESFTALQTDHVEIFMLHQANLNILENEKIASIFLNLKKEGKIRATGVSTYTLEETKRAIELGLWDVIQLPFNLMDQRQETLFKEAQQKGIGIVIRSVLLKGILTSRKKALHSSLINVERHIDNYEELLSETGNDLTALAIKFALSFSEVSSVLIGLDKMSYLKQALDVADDYYLTQKQIKKAKKLSFPDPSFIDLPYWDRMNWLK